MSRTSLNQRVIQPKSPTHNWSFAIRQVIRVMDTMTSHALDDAAPWQHLEPRDLVQPPDDLGGEVAHSGRIEQLGTIVGFIADQVLEPRSATQDGRLKWF